MPENCPRRENWNREKRNSEQHPWKERMHFSSKSKRANTRVQQKDMCPAGEGGHSCGHSRVSGPKDPTFTHKEGGQRVQSTPNTGGDETQSQAMQDHDPNDSDSSQHAMDAHNQPGPSGVPTRAETGSGTPVQTTTTIPATSQQTTGSPDHSQHLSHSDNEGQGPSGTQVVAGNTTTSIPLGSRRHNVPTTSGWAPVARGGSSVGRRRPETDQTDAGPGMSQIQNILEAYRQDTMESSQGALALRNIHKVLAEQHASQQHHQRCMEARMDDISQSLRRIADNMEHPPCVTRQAISRQRLPTGTGREEEAELSDGASHASPRSAHEGPPRKVGRPRKRH